MLFEVYIMFLKNVTLANIKKYKAEHTFEFENRSFINTISGKNGSGTVFFSNCNLNCIYCQNYEISQLGKGKEITIKTVMLVELQKDLETIIELLSISD